MNRLTRSVALLLCLFIVAPDRARAEAFRASDEVALGGVAGSPTTPFLEAAGGETSLLVARNDTFYSTSLTLVSFDLQERLTP